MIVESLSGASPFLRILTLLACFAGMALSHTPAYGAAPVKIGILAVRPKPQALAQWQPLASALKQAMPEQDFAVEVFTDDELGAAVVSRQLDFVLTSPGHYVLLSRRQGLSAPLATLVGYESGQATSAFGGVIFSRAGQAGINSLRDIRGRTVAITGAGNLGGYQMQAYELKQAGIDLPQDVRLVIPGESMDDVVEAVLDGRADVGFARSGLLEHMAQDGRLDMKKLKIVNRQDFTGFPVQVSTRLYPEWIFAALPHADDHVAQHVVATLLLLEENKAAARAMGIHGFSVPANYTPVTDMLREMRFPPFDAAPPFTLRDVWKRYFWQVIGALLLLGLAMILGLRLLLARRQLGLQHQALGSSETRLRTLYESTGDAVMLLDEKCFFDCNNSTLKIFGCASKEEFCSKHPADLAPPTQPCGTDSMVLANQKIATAMEQGSNLFEWMHRRSDTGRDFPAEVLLSRMELDGRKVLQATVRDITERKLGEEVLQKAQLGLVAAQQMAKIGSWEWNVQNNTATWSDETYRLFEIDKSDLSEHRKNFLDLITPEDRIKVDQALSDALDGVKEYDIEYRISLAGGKAKTIHALAEVIRDMQGKAVAMRGTVQDITERKQAEQALMLKNLVFDASIAANSIADINGIITEANEMFVKIWGYQSKEEVIGKPIPHFLDNPDVAAGIVATLDKAGQWEGEYTARKKDGTTFHAYGLATVVKDKDDKTIGYQSAVLDITERKQAEDRLRKLSLAVEQSPASIVITGLDANIEYVNQTFTRETGYSFEEAVWQNPRILKSGKNPVETYREMWACLKRGEAWRGELINRRKDGSEYIEAALISPVRDADGKTTHYLAIKENITARKLAENALNESEDRMRLAVKASGVGFWEWNIAANTIKWDEQMFRIYGMPPGEEQVVAYADWSTAVLPEDLPQQENILQETIRHLGQSVREFRIRRRSDGELRIIQAVDTVRKDATGKACWVVGTNRDITGLKNNITKIERLSSTHRLLSRVNEAIVRAQDRNELYTAICNAAVESGLFRFAWVGILDRQKRAVIPVAYAGVEEGYTDKLNIRLDDARTGHGPTGTAIREGVHVVCNDIGSDPRMAPWRDEALKRGYLASGVFPVYEADGVAGSVNVYAEETGFFTQDIIQLMLELTADVSFALDVFAERRHREQVEDEVKQLNVELERRVAERTYQLEMVNKELETFCYSVSHDLRAPLRGIDGFSQILLKKYGGQLDETGKDYLGRVRRATQRMGELIDDMLQLSQVTRGALRREEADLSSMAQEVGAELHKAHPKRNVRFSAQQGLAVHGDPGLLRILMDNLLGNAWKYTGRKDDAEIEFGACDIDGERTFFVRDNGAGFNMAYAKKLFGAFQRLHAANEFEGTGIGLATVQRIVHRHHGKIWAEAEEGKGATFYFTLPQRERAVDKDSGAT